MLTLDRFRATLETVRDSRSRRGEDDGPILAALAMLDAAPTTPRGTMRAWFTAHDGQRVDTLQASPGPDGGARNVWAPLARTVDASRAGSVQLNGSTRDYVGCRVIGASDDALTVSTRDGSLIVYRVTSN